MAIKLPNLSAALKKQLEAVIKEITSPKGLQEIGDTFAEEIKVRTRLGQSVDKTGGTASKLRPLSEGYVEQRKTMKGQGKLSSATTPGKSNLTQTGQMLDDLKAEVKGESIILTFGEQFSKDKARWNQEKGRPFLYISKIQIQKLKNKIESLVIKALKR